MFSVTVIFLVGCLLLLRSKSTIGIIRCDRQNNVSQTFIATFDGYYSRLDWRRSSIGDIIVEIGNAHVLNRPNILSDFDVIEVDICSAQAIASRLNQLAYVRSVNVDHQIYARRQLLNVGRRDGGGGTKDAAEIRNVAKLLGADRLWEMGYQGQGVKVAVFDTGLAAQHAHFRNIIERTDWTNEHTSDDGLGHGTFVAGVIASADAQCPGLAPAVDLHIYKVFTHKQISYTSWFLDAFNHAILRGIHVLNLSIGGPDFTDQPFMDKVWELTANGIILISAIGNDGPQFGTLNNPADQMDVIGVGGINSDDRIARFSSRGMSTWELPGGYGRVKPDIVTYGTLVYGSALNAGCRALSGTSVASPVVAGAVALLLSAIEDRSKWNPAVVKQALVEGAVRLTNAANMFEQGAGKMDLLASYRYLKSYQPTIILIPPYIDFANECPYMWPYCSQPLYAHALPIIVNVTIVSGLGVTGRLAFDPIWEPFTDDNGDHLLVSMAYSDVIWPWSGYLAIYLSVRSQSYDFDGTAAGRIRLTIQTDAYESTQNINVTFNIRVRIVPTPVRTHRILWDQYRNLRYPPGYFPRDDLAETNAPLDWHGDHPHTNFRSLYQHLRTAGYYVEILGEPYTCVDMNNYALLLIIDPEEEFFPAERQKLYLDVVDAKLGVFIFADWFNASVIDKIRFRDENTRQWWQPETGGSNVPALNDLLSNWNISLDDRVLDGTIAFASSKSFHIQYASGTSIVQTPSNAFVGFASLTDQGDQLITSSRSSVTLNAAVFVLTQSSARIDDGFIAVFGDSTCLESSKQSISGASCFWLIDALLESLTAVDLKSFLDGSSFRQIQLTPPDDYRPPKRITSANYVRYSKVVAGFDSDAQPIYRPMPQCQRFALAIGNRVDNTTMPTNLNEKQLRPRASLLDFLQQQQPPTIIKRKHVHEYGDRRIGEHLYSNSGLIDNMSLLLLSNSGWIFWMIVVVSIFVIFRKSINSPYRLAQRSKIVRWVLRRIR